MGIELTIDCHRLWDEVANVKWASNNVQAFAQNDHTFSVTQQALAPKSFLSQVVIQHNHKNHSRVEYVLWCHAFSNLACH
jgi:hypothetical protein